MKRISEDEKRHRKIIQRRREKRNRVSQRKKLYLRKYSKPLPRKISSNRSQPIFIDVPTFLSLSENYDETLQFFNELRNFGVLQGKNIHINFSKLRTIRPGAALVLAAEIDRWRRSKNIKPRLHRPKFWNKEVRRLLNEMGLFDLIDVANPPETRSTRGRQRFIRFQSADQAIGAMAKELRLSLEQIVGVVARHTELYGALIEAMKNTNQHAYPEGEDYDFPIERNRWWMCGAFDGDSEKLTIMFYDQGVGIPFTLPRIHTIEKVREFLAGFGLPVESDAALIKAALHVGRSRSGLSNRGNGLPQIRGYVQTGQDDRIRILSGRGEYIYMSDGRESMDDKHAPLGGTLIQWEISSAGPTEVR
ncbi:MAG: hypothetical protein WD767_09875 [Alphaproteobacteria bacterium]